MPTEKIHRPWVYKSKPAKRAGEAYYQTAEWKRLNREFFGMVWDKKARRYIRTQNLLCVMCLPKPVEATVADHIIPRRLGGEDEIENLQAICPKCHQKKTALDRKLR